MAIELQNRDLQVLKFVFSRRVASMDQIARRHFSNCARTVPFRRLRLLTRSGLLRSDCVFIESLMRKYVSLTEKGWLHINEAWPYEMDTPHFISESPAHDLRLGDLVSRFEQLATFHSFISENMLQSSSELSQDERLRDLVKLQADGALLLNGADGRIYIYGLEMEISKKNPERLQEKLSAYYMAEGINGVIYVCSSNEIMALLARTDEQIRKERDSILHLGLETDVLNAQEKIFFRNAQKHGIELF